MLIKNRFRIEKEIGRGGIGIVCRAVDVKNGAAPVVIKVLLEHPDEKTRRWIEQHFHDEAESLARINHPGVVQLIDSGVTEDGKPFLAMEFIEGCDLRSQIDPNRGLIGGFERIGRVLRQLGAAVSAAHDCGVWHRDLKPENIILQSPRSPDEEEQVKVIDFGISTVKDAYDEKTKTTLLFAGSKLYMAPEQIENRPTAASDVYAMGAMAYEMITGRAPFVPDSNEPIAGLMQIIKMQAGGVRVKPKALRPSLPEKAEKILLKALAYKPSDRPARAEVFGNELAEALLKTEDAEPATKKSRRFIAVLILLLTTAGIIVWQRIGGSAADPLKTIKTQRSHRLSFWGEMQKYQGDKAVGNPTRVTGGIKREAYFSDGDRLRFFITSSDDGYIYLINEETGTGNAPPKYTILFPSVEANNGSAKTSAERQTATSEFVFDLKSGAEKVWMIWSVDSIAELDKAVQQWINPEDGGEIKDSLQTAFLTRFIEKHKGAGLRVEQDAANEQMRLLSAADVLVYSLILKRR